MNAEDGEQVTVFQDGECPLARFHRRAHGHAPFICVHRRSFGVHRRFPLYPGESEGGPDGRE